MQQSAASQRGMLLRLVLPHYHPLVLPFLERRPAKHAPGIWASFSSLQGQLLSGSSISLTWLHGGRLAVFLFGSIDEHLFSCQAWS